MVLCKIKTIFPDFENVTSPLWGHAFGKKYPMARVGKANGVGNDVVKDIKYSSRIGKREKLHSIKHAKTLMMRRMWSWLNFISEVCLGWFTLSTTTMLHDTFPRTYKRRMTKTGKNPFRCILKSIPERLALINSAQERIVPIHSFGQPVYPPFSPPVIYPLCYICRGKDTPSPPKAGARTRQLLLLLKGNIKLWRRHVHNRYTLNEWIWEEKGMTKQK